MSATDIRAGRAFVEVGTNNSPLYRGLREAAQALEQFGSRVRNIGLTVIAASYPLYKMLSSTVEQFQEFEKRMARVRALTGAAGGDFESLQHKARELGQTTIYSATDAARAMEKFALAGLDVKKILSAAGPTLDLAATGMIDIADAADIGLKIMSGMGIEAKNLGSAFDIMAKAMTTSNTDLKQLGDAVKYAGPVAKAAGVRFEELAAAISILSNAGIQGDMAGTTLRGALLALHDPTDKAAGLMRQMGIRTMDASGNARGLADILQDLEKSMAGLGTGERVKVVGQIFDARQAAGVVELLSKGTSKLREYTHAYENAAGTSARISKTQLNTLFGSFEYLTSNIQEVGLAIGESIGPALRAIVELAARASDGVSRWVKDNRKLVLGLVAAFSAAVSIAGAMVAVGVAIQITGFAASALLAPLAGIGALFGMLITIAGALLSPMGAVAATVLGVAAAFVDWHNTFDDAVNGIIEILGDLDSIFNQTMKGIVDAFKAGDTELAAKIMWDGVVAIWTYGSGTLRIIWERLKQWGISIWGEIQKAAVNAASNFVYAWLIGVRNVQSAFYKLKSYLSNWFENLTDSFTNLFISMMPGLTEEQRNEAFVAAKAEHDSRVGAIKKAADEAQDKVFKKYIDSLEKVVDIQNGLIKDIDDGVGEAGRKAAEAIEAIRTEIQNAANDLNVDVAKAAKAAIAKENEDRQNGQERDRERRKLNAPAAKADAAAGAAKAAIGGAGIGTFNPFVASRLFGTVEGRLVRAAESSLEVQKRLLAAVKQNRGPVFANGGP